LAALRRIVLIALLATLLLAAVVFAYSNPGTLTLDVGIARLEGVPIGGAFAVAFACGWAAGLASAALTLLKGANERRRLRRHLRRTENEVRNLRTVSLTDAD
jgi:uncharacterized membrane protein YciS (DUF1049 family)